MATESYGLLTRGLESIPLIDVKIFADIIGRGASVKVVQHFNNKEDKPIEAVYKFPLPDGATVSGFKATIGEKVITGVVEERDKAFEIYDDELIDGNGAYLLDQERPNIFTLSLGNLNPSSSAIIEIEYVSLLETHGKEVRFLLPMTISPRYIPRNISDGDGIPIEEKINPPLSSDVPYGINIWINIKNPENIEHVESPSHSIVSKITSSDISVEFSTVNVKMDRDFILKIYYKEKFKSCGYLHSYKNMDFIQVDCSFPESHLSPSPDKDEKRINKEIIFVLDCSGSMNGSSIIQAKQAIEIFLRGIESGTIFNIYRFGSHFEKLFTTSVSYTHRNLKKAFQYISATEASFGGTEILSPLRDIYNNISENNKDIILITDGQVGNEKEVISLAKEKRGKNRIFMVGIGYGPNEYLVKQVAKFSGGASEIIIPGERIEPKIIGLFNKVKGANLYNLEILSDCNIEQAPASATIFQDDIVSIFCKFESNLGEVRDIKVRGILRDSHVEWSIPVKRVHKDGEFIPKLWAREIINVFEHMSEEGSGSQQKGRKQNLIKEKIIQISKEHGIVSKETSFIAIERRSDAQKTTADSILRKVPVLLTKDWGGQNSLGIHYISKCPSIDSRQHKKAYLPFEYKVHHWIPNSSFHPNIHFSHEKPLYFKELKDNAVTTITEILRLQQPDGGFILDEEAFVMLGFYLPNLSLSILKNLSEQIQTVKETDRFKLLCTAIVFVILDKKFSDLKKHLWGSVVEKSRKWLKKQIDTTNPLIFGEELMHWVEKTVQN